MIAICRVFIYVCSMGDLIWWNVKNTVKDIRSGNLVKVGPIKIPGYLHTWQDCAYLALATVLMLMLCLEPVLHCLSSNTEETRLTEECPDGKSMIFTYSILSSIAALLYFSLLIDVSVLSTRLSAFVL